MKTTLILLTLPAASAFAPSATTHTRVLRHQAVAEEETVIIEDPEVPAVEPINGWVPDETAPCYGLPGAIAPTGFFDPLGFCQTGIPLNDVKRYREAEVQPGPAFALLTLAIGVAETYRAQVGWVEPGASTLWTLRDTYYPGDVGFDPLNLKPKDGKDFANMQTKELQNGRLAMIGVAGMCAQELCNHKTIAQTYEFYQKINAGIDPYDTAITVGGAAIVPLQ